MGLSCDYRQCCCVRVLCCTVKVSMVQVVKVAATPRLVMAIVASHRRDIGMELGKQKVSRMQGHDQG